MVVLHHRRIRPTGRMYNYDLRHSYILSVATTAERTLPYPVSSLRGTSTYIVRDFDDSFGHIEVQSVHYTGNEACTSDGSFHDNDGT